MDFDGMMQPSYCTPEAPWLMKLPLSEDAVFQNHLAQFKLPQTIHMTLCNVDLPISMVGEVVER
jgi:hypothetical protein